MPCFNPRKGYASRVVNPNGKRSTVWKPQEGEWRRTLPCGNCPGCRLTHSARMAIRATHESMTFGQNSFLTLTYRPENLPEYGSCKMEHAVTFMKDLRAYASYHYGKTGIRSYGCQEYGSKLGRPHYHLCLFNFDFPDKKFRRHSKSGFPVFTSEILSQLWPHGFHEIGSLTFESAAYVARYITKKRKGEDAVSFYEYVDPKTGECFPREPERSICISRRPGLGRMWLEKNFADIYPSDEVTLLNKDGRVRKMRPPPYYDSFYSIANPEEFAKIRSKRRENAVTITAKIEAMNIVDFVRGRINFRMDVLERLAILKLLELQRDYDNEA